MKDGQVREAVGVFEDEASLEAAADTLMMSGFDRADLSIISNHATVKKSLGHDYQDVKEVEDDSAVPTHALVDAESLSEAKAALVAIPVFIGAVATAAPMISYDATITATIIWSGIGGLAGGLIGAIFATMVSKRHKDYVADQVAHGGVLLWVRTIDETREKKACNILKNAMARDVHVHDHQELKGQFRLRTYLDWFSRIPATNEEETVGVNR